MEKLQEIADQWNVLKNDTQRWEYFFANKDKLMLRLDNDSTFVCFRDEIIPDWVEDYDDLPRLDNDFEDWLGDGPGMETMFEQLGVLAEGV